MPKKKKSTSKMINLAIGRTVAELPIEIRNTMQNGQVLLHVTDKIIKGATCLDPTHCVLAEVIRNLPWVSKDEDAVTVSPKGEIVVVPKKDPTTYYLFTAVGDAVKELLEFDASGPSVKAFKATWYGMKPTKSNALSVKIPTWWDAAERAYRRGDPIVNAQIPMSHNSNRYSEALRAEWTEKAMRAIKTAILTGTEIVRIDPPKPDLNRAAGSAAAKANGSARVVTIIGTECETGEDIPKTGMWFVPAIGQTGADAKFLTKGKTFGQEGTGKSVTWEYFGNRKINRQR